MIIVMKLRGKHKNWECARESIVVNMSIIIPGYAMIVENVDLCSFYTTADYYLLCIGAVMISLFHKDIMRKFGNSGVAIAIGKVNRGKSKSVSNALLRKLLLGAMPWCFDDPSDAEQLQRILIAAFGGANMTSHGTA